MKKSHKNLLRRALALSLSVISAASLALSAIPTAYADASSVKNGKKSDLQTKVVSELNFKMTVADKGPFITLFEYDDGDVGDDGWVARVVDNARNDLLIWASARDGYLEWGKSTFAVNYPYQKVFDDNYNYAYSKEGDDDLVDVYTAMPGAGKKTDIDDDPVLDHFWPITDTFQMMDVTQDGNKVTIKNNVKESGWETSLTMVPLKLEVTVPALTTYTVTYQLDLTANSKQGEYSVALINGACNEGLAESTQYPGQTDITTADDTMTYGKLAKYAKTIVGFDQQVSSSDAATQKMSKSSTITLTFTNGSNSSATYSRSYCLYATHCGDTDHSKDTTTNTVNNEFEASLTASVASVQTEAATASDQETALIKGLDATMELPSVGWIAYGPGNTQQSQTYRNEVGMNWNKKYYWAGYVGIYNQSGIPNGQKVAAEEVYWTQMQFLSDCGVPIGWGGSQQWKDLPDILVRDSSKHYRKLTFMEMTKVSAQYVEDTRIKDTMIIEDCGYNNPYSYKNQSAMNIAPFVMSFTVPAQTTVEIHLNFDIDGKARSGDYSVAVFYGESNTGLGNDDQTPDSSASIVPTGKDNKLFPFNQLTKASGVLNGIDHVASGNDAVVKDGITLTFTNKESTPKQFTRSFYAIMTHTGVKPNDGATTEYDHDMKFTITADVDKAKSYPLDFTGGDCSPNVKLIMSDYGDLKEDVTQYTIGAELEAARALSKTGYTTDTMYWRGGSSNWNTSTRLTDAYNVYDRCRSYGMSTKPTLVPDDSADGVIKVTQSGKTDGITEVLAVPFALTVDVPANTIYNVSYKFTLDAKADSGGGSYTAAVTNGACNDSASITTPAALGNILDANWTTGREYISGHMTEIDEAIVGVDYNPVWGSSYPEGKECSQSGSKVFTFQNNTSETVTFVRYFCLNVARCANGDEDMKDFYAKMTVSTDYIKVVKDVESLSSNGSISIGDHTTKFDGSSLNYGLLEGFAYTGNDNSRYLAPSEALPVTSIYQSSYINRYPGLINGDTIHIAGLYNTNVWTVMPVQLTYTVPAKSTVTVRYQLDLSTYDTRSEYALGVMEAASSPDDNDPSWGGIAMYNSDTLSLDGSKTSRNIVSLNRTLTAEQYGEVSAEKVTYTTICDFLAVNYNITPSGTGTGNNGIVVKLANGNDMIKVGMALTERFSNSITMTTSYTATDSRPYSLTIYLKNGSGVDDESDKRTAYSRAASAGGVESTSGSVSFKFDNSASSTAVTFSRVVLVYMVFQTYCTEENVDSSYAYFNARVKFTPKLISTRQGNEEEAISGSDITWDPIYPDALEETLKNNSDGEYATAYGWYRLLMRLEDFTYTDYGKTVTVEGEETTLTGKVSGTAYTTVQQYYTHPLGQYLRYAWLYNGTASEPGAYGKDYATPQAVTKTQKMNIDFDMNETMDDYEAWYIKYAGEVNGKATYYLAMEGTDGKRYLLCNNYYQLGTADPKTIQTFVTASDYDKYVDIYRNGFAWPTSPDKAKTNLNNSTVAEHQYLGHWYLSNSDQYGDQIAGNGLQEEAFRVPLNNNLQWSISSDNNTHDFNGFVSAMSVNSGAFEATKTATKSQDGTELTTSLYAFYTANVGKSNTIGTMLEKYKYAIEAELKVARGEKALPETRMGLAHGEIESADDTTTDYGWSDYIMDAASTEFRQVKNADEACTMYLYLGTYADTAGDADIVVHDGETYTVSGQVRVDSNSKLIVERGGTLQVRGDLIVAGSLVSYGDVYIESGGCIREANDKASGRAAHFSFVGSNVVIAPNGVFCRYVGSTGSQTFSHNSAIYNDGLFICGTGGELDSSTFENGTHGVMLLGYELKKDFNMGGIAKEIEEFPRGTPTAEQKKTLKGEKLQYETADEVKARREKTTLYPEEKYALTLSNYSVLINNGAVYDLNGISADTSIIMGMNSFMYSIDITGDKYKIITDSMNSSVYVAFGCQSVADACQSSNIMTYDQWKTAYNSNGMYVEKKKSGC